MQLLKEKMEVEENLENKEAENKDLRVRLQVWILQSCYFFKFYLDKLILNIQFDLKYTR